jgi:hypothetical protein
MANEARHISTGGRLDLDRGGYEVHDTEAKTPLFDGDRATPVRGTFMCLLADRRFEGFHLSAERVFQQPVSPVDPRSHGPQGEGAQEEWRTLLLGYILQAR